MTPEEEAVAELRRRLIADEGLRFQVATSNVINFENATRNLARYKRRALLSDFDLRTRSQDWRHVHPASQSENGRALPEGHDTQAAHDDGLGEDARFRSLPDCDTRDAEGGQPVIDVSSASARAGDVRRAMSSWNGGVSQRRQSAEQYAGKSPVGHARGKRAGQLGPRNKVTSAEVRSRQSPASEIDGAGRSRDSRGSAIADDHVRAREKVRRGVQHYLSLAQERQ